MALPLPAKNDDAMGRCHWSSSQVSFLNTGSSMVVLATMNPFPEKNGKRFRQAIESPWLWILKRDMSFAMLMVAAENGGIMVIEVVRWMEAGLAK